MKPIETYKCEDCNHEWGIAFVAWERPDCPECGEYLNVVETTDLKDGELNA